MPATYQNVLALMVSVVIHLVVIGLLTRVNLPAGRASNTLEIIVTESKSQTTSPATPSSSSAPPSASIEPPPPSQPPVERRADTPSTPEQAIQPKERSYNEPRRPPVSPSQPSINLPKIPDLDALFQNREATSSPGAASIPSSASRRTTPHPSLLSLFQPYLLDHISQKKYHDKQYPFSQLKSAREVVLLITLQANGTLVRIKVLESSGDSALDEAAKRATIAASPFDRPPVADARFDYTYQIPIRYMPN